MKVKIIEYSSKFLKNLKKLTLENKRDFLQREIVFQNDCFDPKLKTHKLSGKYKSYWSFSVNYSLRIMFEIVGEGIVRFINIGNHGIYK